MFETPDNKAGPEVAFYATILTPGGSPYCVLLGPPCPVEEPRFPENSGYALVMTPGVPRPQFGGQSPKKPCKTARKLEF